MKRKFASLVVLFFLVTNILLENKLFAQTKFKQERIDSLLKVLPTLKNDTSKIELFNDLSFTFSTIGEADEGIVWGERALALSIKLSYKIGEADAYNRLSANLWEKHDYINQQKYLLRSLAINQKLNDRFKIAHIMRDIGDIYETEYDYTRALEYYQKSLAIAREINNTGEQIAYLAYIANAYDAQKKYAESIAYYQEAIRMHLYVDTTKVKYELGGLFRRLGLVYANQGDYQKALDFEKKGLSMNLLLINNNEHKNQYKWSLRALAIVYLKKGDYSQAIFYFRKALYQFRLFNDAYSKNNVGICLCKMGCAYLEMAKSGYGIGNVSSIYLEKAKDTLLLAIKWLKPKDWTSLTEAYQNLSFVYQLLNKNLAALDAYKQFSIYTDSLNNSETEKKIIIQEMGYENGRLKDSMARASLLQSSQFRDLMQQQELVNLRVRQQRIYIVLAFACVSLLTVYFLYRKHVSNRGLQNELANERLGKELRSAEHEKEVSRATLTALVAQMNPHFLFNALNTVQSFIYRDDKRNAAGYLGKFSDLTRRILDNSGKKAISLEEEAALLRLYLELEGARFGSGFAASVEVDAGLDAGGIFLPPMLVQPYVENAVKNGLLHKHGHRELRVCISAAGPSGGIRVVVDDNGIGREKSRELNRHGRPGHSPFGSAATQRRIDLINHGLDRKIELSIIDKKDGDGAPAGTTVVIVIPKLKLA